MFEHLKQAQQRPGMSRRERLRLWVMGASLVLLAGAFLSVRNCKTLPGSRDLPSPADRAEIERLNRHIDRAKLRALAPDDAGGMSQFHVAALEYVRVELSKGLGDMPQPMLPAALAALPPQDGVGGYYEVEGRITALTSTEYRSDLERLWTMVIQGDDGGQVVAVRRAQTVEPGQGAPTDSWVVAPTELKVGDRVLARGVYVQRRVGTIGGIGLSEPTPVLLTSLYRRVVEPVADVISSPKEASLDRIDDQFQAGTLGLEDPAIYQILQWIKARGHAWFRQKIDAGELKPLSWGRDAFEAWSAEVNLRAADAPRPFTLDARGRLYKTSGMVGLSLLEDWDTVKPNPWGVHQFHFIYLWSDFYGNTVLPCLSAFPLEVYGAGDWRRKDRVYLYGIFVKNYTYDTQRLRADGEGAQKLTTPLFLVVDVRPYPIGVRQDSTPLAWILGGLVAGLAVLFLFLMRSEKRQEAERQRRRAEKLIARHGLPGMGRPGPGAGPPTAPPTAPPESGPAPPA